MEKDKHIQTPPPAPPPAKHYAHRHIPAEDLPQNLIPHEVPGKRRPGGENGE